MIPVFLLPAAGLALLDNSAQIQIVETNPNASLTLYVGGNYEEKNGGGVNNLFVDGSASYLTFNDIITNADLVLP